MTPLLSAQGVSRRFASGRGLAEIDFELRQGELVALVGPSGAGKTTLLRVLAGLIPADQGSVELAGQALLRRQHGDTRIAMVYQTPRLVGRLDALHNVLTGRLGHLSYWRGLLGLYHPRDRQLALAALKQVGLLEHAFDRTDRLSGGEQQRISIARALAQEPRILLADEPVASLDPYNAETIMQVLRSCANAGLAVVASLHQPQLAQAYADRIVRLG